jgi:hypothetical protein
MDRISVSNLFPSTNDFRPLDVNNLYNTREQKTKNKLNFNIDKLIKIREERKKKIIVQYEKIFNICLNKITLANRLNKTEVIYEIPDAIYGHLEYNIVDCIAYVNSKLEQLHFDTLIFGKVIYISWLDLEKNIAKSDMINKT